MVKVLEKWSKVNPLRIRHSHLRREARLYKPGRDERVLRHGISLFVRLKLAEARGIDARSVRGGAGTSAVLAWQVFAKAHAHVADRIEGAKK